MHRPEPTYSLPLQEIDVAFGNGSAEPGLLDPGSQIVVICKDLAQELNTHINAGLRIEMEGANSATNWTLGCAENIPMRIGGVSFKLHAHVVERAPFRLLLGRPFQHQVLCSLDPLPDGSLEVFIRDPSDISRRILVPSRARTAQVASIRVVAAPSQPRVVLVRCTTPSCALALSGFCAYPGEARGPPAVAGPVPRATRP